MAADRIHHPFAFAKRVIDVHFRGYRWQMEDMLADGVYGVALAEESWRPDGGRGIGSWAWLHAQREIGRGIARRARWDIPVSTLPDSDGGWLDIETRDHGIEQVEDRAVLQRWADMAWLTDFEADSLAHMSVHLGTIVKHAGGRARWFPEVPRSYAVGWRSGVEKMRVAANRERRIHERRAAA